MKIIHRNCQKSLSEDKSLPRNTYLVSYYDDDNNLSYDIVQENAKVQIFDYYWDTYRNVQSINWTKGTANPKIAEAKPKKK